MYLNNYSVRVVGGNEKQDGYVELGHNQVYSLVLKNDKDTRCDAQVVIDGKEIGTFRIEAKMSLSLERPSNEARKFTFYETDSQEAQEAGASKIIKSDMGLISVTFMPEKIRFGVVAEKHKPWKYPPHPLYRSPVTPEWVAEKIVEQTCSNNGILRGMSTDTFSATSRNTEYTTQEVLNQKSGMTGLSEKSAQRFYEVPELNYDTSNFITINLRLVSKEKGVYEMKPIVKSNPVPPPID